MIKTIITGAVISQGYDNCPLWWVALPGERELQPPCQKRRRDLPFPSRKSGR